jgi:predicted nucleic acid-binding protein
LTTLQPDEDDRVAAIRLFLGKRDRKLSLCDALSYVVVSAHLDWVPCLSFDADFRAMGLTVVRQVTRKRRRIKDSASTFEQ